MARLKYKVRHENFLFGLKILFSFCWGEGGEGLGLYIGFGERSWATNGPTQLLYHIQTGGNRLVDQNFLLLLC